ncbi:MAG: hypothetical protein ACPGOV_05530 [Magnetovibrionaceae bacterium]
MRKNLGLNFKVLVGAVVATGLLSACQTTKEAANLASLGVSFEWQATDRCSTSSPAFSITGIPEGTASLQFKMTDLDVPTYNHGGGKVVYSGSGSIPAGSFSYKGPCPPGGQHNYQFDVKALNAAGDTILGKGSATRAFPPN